MNSLVDLVNPLLGTDSTYTYSHGNTLPLISMPFGMASWSMQTRDDRWFYHPNDHQLQGIRLTHQPSPWIRDYGHVVMMPQTGQRLLTAERRSSVYRLSNTIVKPNYFKVYLGRYQTTLELSPSERCAHLRISYPSDQSARFIIESCSHESEIKIHARESIVTGWTQGNNGGVSDNFAIYFVIAFDCHLNQQDLGTFQRDSVFKGSLRRRDERIGAYIGFNLPSNQIVHVRIATSFISLKQAKINLLREIGKDSFEQTKEKAKSRWNQYLEKIQIEGQNDEQAVTFYSCLYRSFLFPRKFYEIDEKENRKHYSPYDGTIHDGVLYADNGFWDTHRTVYPLFSLLIPRQLTEILEGWTNAYCESGWFPRWSSPGHRDKMVGTHIDAVMADAVTKGIRNFNLHKAYEGLIKHASVVPDQSAYGRASLDSYLKLGYVPIDQVPYSVSRTLDYAYCDFCIAQIAKALGKSQDYQKFIQRAFNYRNVFDPSVGFMRGKKSDGSWQEPFNEFSWGGPYVEGGPWQCSWAVPHDPRGLADLMGGKGRFIEKLDQMLAMEPFFEVGTYQKEIHEMTEMASVDFGQYAHSNQPVHHVLYMFAALGYPSKTRFWTRKVLQELYGSGCDGFPGDEDNGEMASWYILSSMGLYQLCPGHPSYVLGNPLFKKITLNSDNGQHVHIECKNSSNKNIYVQKVLRNNVDYPKLFITHSDLIETETLAFTMTDHESSKRVDDPANLPFSMSESVLD